MIRVQKKSLPITPKGLTTVERKLTVSAAVVTKIRAMAEQAIRQVDTISAQSRVADGTNVSIRLTIGTVQMETGLLGLEKLEDSGPQINNLIKEINRLLPDTLQVE